MSLQSSDLVRILARYGGPFLYANSFNATANALHYCALGEVTFSSGSDYEGPVPRRCILYKMTYWVAANGKNGDTILGYTKSGSATTTSTISAGVTGVYTITDINVPYSISDAYSFKIDTSASASGTLGIRRWEMWFR